MTQNLRLRLTNGQALTPETSDVTQNWNPGHTTSVGSSGPIWWNSGQDYNVINSHYANNETNGTYYTWQVATAGTGNTSTTANNQHVPDSICPKGWKLPKGGSNVNENDFSILVSKYGGTGSAGSANLRSAPLNFPLSGNYSYNNGRITPTGSNAFFWAATSRSSNRAYILYFTTSGVYPEYNHNRMLGYTVRCIARGPEITEGAFMQDVTKEMCDNTPEHKVLTLRDKRDNNTYKVTKAKDGKCWMAQNLRLKLTNGQNLTPETSDVTQNWNPSHTTSVGSSGPVWWSSGQDYNVINSHYANNEAYGAYYSWAAATAGTGNSSTSANNQHVPSSICPKGWKLPKSGTNTNENDFRILVNKYGGTGNAGSSNLRSAPLGFHISGFYNYKNGQIYNTGSDAFFWSATSYYSSHAYTMYFTTSVVYPENYNYTRMFGFTVRCLIR